MDSAGRGSNGIAFSPDEKIVYIADTGKVGKIRAFAVPESGPLGEPVMEIDVRCDGMCVDTNGNIYTTSSGGIHVFDKDGKKLGVIGTPEQPANVCFGGEDRRTLFTTELAPGRVCAIEGLPTPGLELNLWQTP